jgi:hypothetical protein
VAQKPAAIVALAVLLALVLMLWRMHHISISLERK